MPFCLSRHSHASISEASYCDWLLALKQAREIKDYSLYPSIKLHIKGRYWKTWKCDFEILENDGSTSYHESKGWNRSDDSFRLRLAAALTEYPDIKFYVNKKPAILSPGCRLILAGIKPKKKRIRTVKSYNYSTGRYERVRIR